MSGTSAPTRSSESASHDHATDGPPPRRFRFKDKSRSSRDQRTTSRSTAHASDSRNSPQHHSSHHRRKRRKASSQAADEPTADDDARHTLPPEAAFRESLFDALADDEGAMFWEGVYGQPIHHYPQRYVDPKTGQLEQMDDDEYAEYVRRKMWEKSWEGIEAAREERRHAQKAAERSRPEQDECRPGKADRQNGRRFEFEVEESLKRGEERRERKRWKTVWDNYVHRWTTIKDLVDDQPTDAGPAPDTWLGQRIAWPVASGKRDDVVPAQIETFLVNGTTHAHPDLPAETALARTLKIERVRWHPDKIQQRFGKLGVDERTMQGVTAVFQVLDRMWSERKGQT